MMAGKALREHKNERDPVLPLGAPRLSHHRQLRRCGLPDRRPPGRAEGGPEGGELLLEGLRARARLRRGRGGVDFSRRGKSTTRGVRVRGPMTETWKDFFDAICSLTGSETISVKYLEN